MNKPYDVIQEIYKICASAQSIAHYNWGNIQEICKENTLEETAMVCIKAAFEIKQENITSDMEDQNGTI